jgi:hypothetical protein
MLFDALRSQNMTRSSLLKAVYRSGKLTRLSYVVTYRPVGVEHKGWHEIAVAVS